MLCDVCKKKPATVHFKEACNGQIREMHVCEECAVQSGLDAGAPVSLADLLFGAAAKPPPESLPDKSCPNCHMRQRDFSKTSRLGCARCYDAFREEMRPMLDGMQKGRQHVGKVPARVRCAQSAAVLRRRLDTAVAAEKFEEAAHLRDRIAESEARARPARGRNTAGVD
ncbi:MAG: excinuclease ABC subunit B [Lentisphaerae bacterium]|nr:excinuclease ABC subunit B [Lentisphaerota bacterium]